MTGFEGLAAPEFDGLAALPGFQGFDGLSAYPSALTPMGWTPIPIEAILTRGQDWIVTLVPTGPNPWPAGTAITAYVYAANTNISQPLSTWTQEYSWDATIDPTTGAVYFRAPYADTDTVEEGAIVRIMADLPDDDETDHFVWG
jgi:hypothetical protein